MGSSGIVDAFVTIARQGGVAGLWKGVLPNCQRAGLVQLGDLTAYAEHFTLRCSGHLALSSSRFVSCRYDASKQRIKAFGVEEGPVLHAMSSGWCISGPKMRHTITTGPSDNVPVDLQEWRGLLRPRSERQQMLSRHEL